MRESDLKSCDFFEALVRYAIFLKMQAVSAARLILSLFRSQFLCFGMSSTSFFGSKTSAWGLEPFLFDERSAMLAFPPQVGRNGSVTSSALNWD